MTFEGLNLSLPILQALKSKGYTEPTPVQAKAIPLILEGRDIFGCARTGTGKTAAFALPVLHLLKENNQGSNKVRALVLAPTRELAQQISDSFNEYGRNLGLKHTVVYGGVSQHNQVRSLQRGCDVIIATPGRLMDLMQQRFINLSNVEYLILDEADRMLDMGFIHDINKICSKIPAKRQTLFFSATLSPEIKKLAANLLNDPANVDIKPDYENDTVTKEHLYFINRNSKTDLLKHLFEEENIGQALVFTRTKRGADKLVKMLSDKGIASQAIHGDKSQSQRTRALENFKRKKVNLLIATDVASRGIDVKDLSHVINYDMPDQAETYTHRIGRTGRAGQDGIAFSFCSNDEKSYLRDIQRSRGKSIPVAEHPYSKIADDSFDKPNGNKRYGNGGGNGNGGGSSQRNENSSRSFGYGKNKKPRQSKWGKPKSVFSSNSDRV